MCLFQLPTTTLVICDVVAKEVVIRTSSARDYCLGPKPGNCAIYMMTHRLGVVTSRIRINSIGCDVFKNPFA